MIVYKMEICDDAPEKKVIKLPKGSKILSFQEQNRVFCIWFLCDPKEKATDMYQIVVIGTGNDFGEHRFGVDETWNFIGTAISNSGRFVVHCFAKLI
jgi:hypothetical protein